MGRFKDLAGVRTNQGGLYFLAGDYVVELDEVKLIQNRKRQDCFIISGRVVKSTNPDRQPGCKPSQVLVLRDDIIETIMGNIKQFAAACLQIDDPDNYVPDDGSDVESFWDDALELMISDEQPLKDTKIHLHCATIQTKAGGDFTKHTWGPVID